MPLTRRLAWPTASSILLLATLLAPSGEGAAVMYQVTDLGIPTAGYDVPVFNASNKVVSDPTAGMIRATDGSYSIENGQGNYAAGGIERPSVSYNGVPFALLTTYVGQASYYGDDEFFANAVNKNGMVVGSEQATSGLGVAFYYTPSGGMKAVPEVYPSVPIRSREVLMRGGFRVDRFRFEVARDVVDLVDHGTSRRLYDELDPRLTRSGKLPDLGGAPVASWLLARLGKLTDAGFPLFGEEENDGGGYLVEFLVFDDIDEIPVAEFQLQGNSEGACILGYLASDCSPEAIAEAFASALLADPEGLAPCQLSVIDLEWEEVPESYRPIPNSYSRNDYGWNGRDFFGSSNIRHQI
jgi:hypothetical protein